MTWPRRYNLALSDLSQAGAITPDLIKIRMTHDISPVVRTIDIRSRAGKSRERAAHRSGIDLSLRDTGWILRRSPHADRIERVTSKQKITKDQYVSSLEPTNTQLITVNPRTRPFSHETKRNDA